MSFPRSLPSEAARPPAAHRRGLRRAWARNANGGADSLKSSYLKQGAVYEATNRSQIPQRLCLPEQRMTPPHPTEQGALQPNGVANGRELDSARLRQDPTGATPPLRAPPPHRPIRPRRSPRRAPACAARARAIPSRRRPRRSARRPPPACGGASAPSGPATITV